MGYNRPKNVHSTIGFQDLALRKPICEFTEMYFCFVSPEAKVSKVNSRIKPLCDKRLML
jgi:hypothetical protein